MISLLSDIEPSEDDDDFLDTEELGAMLGAALELAEVPMGLATMFKADYDTQQIKIAWEGQQRVFSFALLIQFLNDETEDEDELP